MRFKNDDGSWYEKLAASLTSIKELFDGLFPCRKHVAKISEWVQIANCVIN